MTSTAMPTNAELRDFLILPYAELEELNLRAKQQRQERVPLHALQEQRLKYLADEPRIKALTVLFSDLEGRLHMLDYDKKFLLESHDNLTFDGSSIRGFTPQRESDLRLSLDWSAFYWGPADIFGPGKVLVFGDVFDRDGQPFAATFAARSRSSPTNAIRRKATRSTLPTRSKAFSLKGSMPSGAFTRPAKFEYVNTGGYYHSLPGDPLRDFIDTVAEVQRAMGFQNEKDHPEVAPVAVRDQL